MRVLITGVHGFLGSALAGALRERGHDVRGTTSRADRADDRVVFLHQLGARPDPLMMVGVDVVVHAACDLSVGSHRRNVDGTIALADAATHAGVAHQLLVSSYSAHQGAASEYARTKLALEAYFVPRAHAVVRPGLIVGHGGLYATLSREVRARRVVPVPYPSALVPLVAIADIVTCLVALVEHPRSGAEMLYHRDLMRMGDFFATIRDTTQAPAVLVPVPYAAALLVARFCELCHIPSPLTSDALRALRANQAPMADSTLERYVTHPCSPLEMIRAAH